MFAFAFYLLLQLMREAVAKPREQMEAHATQLALLQRAFPDAYYDIIQQQLQQCDGDVSRAFERLLQLSSQELQQPLTDEAGRAFFTWPVSLEQCQQTTTMRGADELA